MVSHNHTGILSWQHFGSHHCRNSKRFQDEELRVDHQYDRELAVASP
jgi:hypothetical protein